MSRFRDRGLEPGGTIQSGSRSASASCDGLAALAGALPIERVGEALRRLFGALDKPLMHFVPLSIQRSIAILVRRLGNEPDLERVETVVAQIARTPAHAYLRLGALVSALESL